MASQVDEVIRFLQLYPQYLGWRGKNKPDLSTLEGKQAFRLKFQKAQNAPLQLSTPKTVPDSAVSVLLGAKYGYSAELLTSIKNQHLQSMAAENMVGELLERYIDTELSKFGWIRCWGETAKSIDFIKPESTDFIMLQIKNRDNSENSSSKAIRDGTNIKHWFRTFAKTGATNWNAFPDINARTALSESGFQDFIKAQAPNL